MSRMTVKKYRASKPAAKKKTTKKTAKKENKPFVAVLLHGGELRGTFVSSDYYKVLKFAGDYWETAGYGFDIAKGQPFFIPDDYDSGDFQVKITGGKVVSVHSFDETIHIRKMGPVGW